MSAFCRLATTCIDLFVCFFNSHTGSSHVIMILQLGEPRYKEGLSCLLDPRVRQEKV